PGDHGGQRNYAPRQKKRNDEKYRTIDKDFEFGEHPEPLISNESHENCPDERSPKAVHAAHHGHQHEPNGPHKAERTWVYAGNVVGVKASGNGGKHRAQHKYPDFVARSGDPHAFGRFFLFMDSPERASHPGMKHMEAKDQRTEDDAPYEIVPCDFAGYFIAGDPQCGNVGHPGRASGPVYLLGQNDVDYYTEPKGGHREIMAP